MLLPQIKQTIGWGKRMVCSGKSDDVFYPNRPCNFRTYQVPFCSGRTVTFILEYFVCRNERSIFVIQL